MDNIVYKYNDSTLISLFSDLTPNSKHEIESKAHIPVLLEYLKNIGHDNKKLGIKTIVVEKDYIDKDFLIDYQAFYCRCFQGYNKKCSRLHFFNHSFSQVEFINLLSDVHNNIKLKNILTESYCGYIVVKPLPNTFIGKTCLITYNSDNNHRKFPSTMKNEVSLFGLKLSIDSIPFQEQDQTVAACATTALWTALNKTAKLFNHQIPSPSEITVNAFKYNSSLAPIFPNEGLSLYEMAAVIKHYGLEPIILSALPMFRFIYNIYAYSYIGIPCILGAQVLTKSKELIGRHAVTITGYNRNTKSRKTKAYDICLSAMKIKKLYVHDDQVGPFSRIKIRKDGLLEGSWTDSSGNKLFLKPEHLIIPIYHKIRITMDDVYQEIAYFSDFLKDITKRKYYKEFEWDIFLTDVSDYKNKLLDIEIPVKDQKIDILLENMPHYLWIARLKYKNLLIMDIVYDSTEKKLSKRLVINLVTYNQYYIDFVKYVIENDKKKRIQYKAVEHIFDKIEKT